jgi:hypothetical protein
MKTQAVRGLGIVAQSMRKCRPNYKGPPAGGRWQQKHAKNRVEQKFFSADVAKVMTFGRRSST